MQRWPQAVETMGRHERRQRTHEPAPAPARRLAEWLRWPASVLAVATVAAGGLVKLYLLVTSLLSGVYTNVRRVGPTQVYVRDADPQGYWFWMAMDGLFTVLLLLAAVATGWVLLVLSRPRRRSR